MRGETVIRLILALTIVVSVFLRPPGTMLVRDGDTITYELCTGGEVKNVTVALDGDVQDKVDLGCDFFSAQIGALPIVAPDIAPIAAEATRLAAPVAPQTHAGRTGWHLYTPRAPPLVS